MTDSGQFGSRSQPASQSQSASQPQSQSQPSLASQPQASLQPDSTPSPESSPLTRTGMRPVSHLGRRLIAGLALAALWLVFGLGPYALQHLGGRVELLGRLIPSPMRGGFFGAPEGWAWSMHSLAVLLVITGFATISAWFGRRMRLSFAAGWLAAVLTGFLIGAVLDLGDFVESVGLFGVRGALGTRGATQATVFWGLLVGWIPGVLVSAGAQNGMCNQVGREAGEDAAGQSSKASVDVLKMSRGYRAVNTAIAVLAILAAVALPLVASGAHTASQEALREEQAAEEAAAEANADPAGAAPRDLEATGEPVPTVAPVADTPPADACDASNSTILAPPAGAATGHRVQSLELVNISEAPCRVEGYPDIAFGDQNGHVMDVVVERGDSFLAKDAGPTLITVEPGESVVASIGWDANSMHGSLAARSLWVAQFAGAERLTWEVLLDIVPESTVYVTAWGAE
ncbi:DUF4232 domain-containing protein [Gulosibacter chungangensis]|uniref:DUF4232 domain-containing protein n=1 Tax=Gulosibacter chungangensis TaxID=979746 RepID=A0A7J5BA08_9MICO|nr:DUF4232 domain-containing protein [Gulosibacter chungangensis]